MNIESISFRRYKVHGTSLDGKTISEYPSRYNLEDVELDIERAKERGCEGVVIYEAKEVRIFIS
ncbi:MAG: hypothetical protein CL883_05575 [Dehalococcoidia bacterium]|nr:hypothetical protein [Dehalococcoidia bacterium]|tara:strand:- start:777 stop:968 length:192 start_codon:yes stop_codon:yes gene_type:complete